MLITRLGAVASQQPFPILEAEYSAQVGGLSMAALADPVLEATHAAAVDGLSFGAAVDDSAIAMFAASVDGLSFGASGGPVVDASQAATVSGLSFGAEVDPVISAEVAASVSGLTFGASGGEPSNEDPDAAAYLNAVEAADTQALEPAVRAAVNAFVIGCKDDGIWDAIKLCCILAGARTIDGCIVPLKGPTQTKFGFTNSHYNRKTGIQGQGSLSFYIDTNYNNNEDPQNDNHNTVFVSAWGASGALFGTASSGSGTNGIAQPFTSLNYRSRRSANAGVGTPTLARLYGTARQQSGSFERISLDGTIGSATGASESPAGGNLLVFRMGGVTQNTTSRIAFYSAGEYLDLALLDARVSALMTALDSAIS